MNTKSSLLLAATCLFFGVAAQPALADRTEILDFEDFDTGNMSTAALINLPYLNVRFDLDFAILSIVELFSPVQGWGNQSLLLNSGIQSPLTISFLDGATAFGIEYGDIGADADAISFSIYSGILGTGELIERIDLVTTTDIGLLGPELFEFATADGSLGIGSVIIETAGTGGAPSLFFDNLSVTVPTPMSSAPLLALGLLAARRRRVK